MKKIALLSVLVSLGFGMAACDEEGESGSLINCNNYPNSKAAFTSMIKATDSCDAVQKAEQNFYDTANAESFPDSEMAKSLCSTEWLTAQTTDDAKKALDAWNGFGDSCKSDMIDVLKPALQETVGKIPGSSQPGENNKPGGDQDTGIKCDDYSKTKTEFLAAAKLDGSDCEAFKAAADKVKTADVEEKVMSSASDDEGLSKVLSECYEKWGATKEQKEAFDQNSKKTCDKPDEKDPASIKCDELPSTKEKLLAAIASDGSDCKAHNQLRDELNKAAVNEKVMSSADDADGLANLVKACGEAWKITEEQFKAYGEKTNACKSSGEPQDEKIKCGDYTKTPKAIQDAIKLDDKHCNELKTAVDAIAKAAAEEKLISSADKTDDLKKVIDTCASEWKITKENLELLEKNKTSCASQQGGDDDFKCDEYKDTKAALMSATAVKKDSCGEFEDAIKALLAAAASEKAISSNVDANGLNKVLNACLAKWGVTQEQIDNYNHNMEACYQSADVKCDELPNTKKSLEKVIEAADKECSEFEKAMGELETAASDEKAIASESDINGLNNVINTCWQSWKMTAEQIQKINNKSQACMLPSKEIKCSELTNTKAEVLKIVKMNDQQCTAFLAEIMTLLKAAKDEKAIESEKDTEEMLKVMNYCYNDWGVTSQDLDNFADVLKKCIKD